MRGEWLSIRVLPSEKGPGRFGCTVRRGAAGGAVERNRVKRWLRESFRQHPGALPEGLDLVAVVQRLPEKISYRQVEAEYLSLCKQAKSQ